MKRLEKFGQEIKEDPTLPFKMAGRATQSYARSPAAGVIDSLTSPVITGGEKLTQWEKKELGYDNRQEMMRLRMQQVNSFIHEIEERADEPHHVSKITAWLYKHRRDYVANKTDEVSKAVYQDAVTAFCLYRNRKEFGEGYDAEKEQRQIEGIVAILEKNHLHMGTGEGKSTVVLPIAAIAHALTSPNEPVILTTAKKEDRIKLEKYTQRYLKALPPLLKIHHEVHEEHDDKKDQKAAAQNRIQNVLKTGDYSPEDKQYFHDAYWAERMKKPEPEKKKPEGPSIVFSTNDEVVFKYMGDKAKFKESYGVIIADEADTDYRSGKRYEQTSDSGYHSPEEIEQSFAKRIMYGAVLENLNNVLKEPKYVYLDKGHYGLTDEGFRKLIEMNPADGNIYDRQIKQLTKQFGLSPQDDLQLRKRLFQRIGSSIKQYHSLACWPLWGLEGGQHKEIRKSNNRS